MSIFEHFSEEEREILRIRAERAANAVRESAQEAVFSALEVTIQSQSYALPIEVLTTVYENVAVVPVPCVPSFVAGIANIRGRILPVFDLAVLLDQRVLLWPRRQWLWPPATRYASHCAWMQSGRR